MMDLPLYVHVGGGFFALVAGAIALSLRKGSRLHRNAGYTFLTAIIVMAVPGGLLSYAADKLFDVLGSLLACYMVITGWLAFKPISKRASFGFMCLAIMCFAGYLTVELAALIWDVRATDAPAGAGYVFASILALAVVGDFKVLRKAYSRKQTTIRHLWRMNFGLFLATVSIFGARPHLFPEWMQTYGLLLLLSLAPILAMSYWRFRLRERAS